MSLRQIGVPDFPADYDVVTDQDIATIPSILMKTVSLGQLVVRQWR